MAGPAFLWRINPRTTRYGLVYELTQRRPTEATSVVLYEAMFGLFGATTQTGNAGGTVDAIGWITNYPFTYQGSQSIAAAGNVTMDAAIATGQAQSIDAHRNVPAHPAFTVLERANPRSHGYSVLFRFAQRAPTMVYGDIAADVFFGVFGHSDSQQAQTIDAIGDVVTPAAAVFLTFQGQTIDAAGIVKVDAVITTGQGQTIDAAGSSPIDATIATSQGQTIAVVTNYSSDAAIATAQGQTIAVVTFASPIDSAIATSQGQTIAAVGSAPINATLSTSQGQGIVAAGDVTPRYVAPVGFDSFQGFGFGSGGSGWVSFLDRTILPSGIVATFYGTALAADVDRNVSVASINDGAFGTAFVAYRVREILPLFIPATSYGTPVVDETHFLTTSGFDTVAFGTANVHDNTQQFFLTGFAAGAIGDTVVTPNPRPVAPVGFPSTNEFGLPSERWGLPTVFNSTQIVRQLFATTPLDGGVFGDSWNTLVANVNREVGEIGWPSQKFGRPEVALLDQAAAPEGDDLSLFGNQLVAYRIRTYFLDGIEPGQIGEYTVVRNNARLVAPEADDLSAFGRPAVENTRRYYSNVTLQDQSSVGTAFVDFAIRTVTVPGGPESVFGTADVQNLTHYVAPDGIGTDNVSIGVIGQWGLTDVLAHRNIVAPSWVWRGNFVSENSYVHNRNQSIGMYGLDQADYGHATVFNVIQYVTAGGIAFAVLGAELAVSRRTRTITVPGLNAGDVPQHAHASKTTPDPPFAQTVTDAGAGLQEAVSQLANVHTNILRPAGLDASSYGTPTVRSNVIFASSITPDYYPEQWGLPSLNYPQTVDLNNQFGNAPGNAIAPPDDPTSPLFYQAAHRLNPFTIYCTTAKPFGYTPSGPTWELIDSYLSEDPARPLFGRPNVDFKNRRYQASGVQDDVFGTPEVTLRRKFVLPDGLLSLRMGYPMTNGAQFIDMQDYNVGGEQFGAVVVAHIVPRPNPWPVNPAGFDASTFTPNIDVDFFNRTRAMVGWDSFTMTSPQPYNPHTFGPLSTRVHFFEPNTPPGIDSAAFGTQWVSLRVRTVFPEGDEMLDMTPGVGDFADHMKVTRRTYIEPPSIASAVYGTARLIRHNFVAPSSIADGAFGVARKHQDGDQDITGAGFDAGDFGVATTTHADGDDFVCGQLPRAIPPQGFEADTIGAHTVTHG